MKALSFYISRLTACHHAPVIFRGVVYRTPVLPACCYEVTRLITMIWRAVFTAAVTIPPACLRQMLDHSQHLLDENDAHLVDDNGDTLTW